MNLLLLKHELLLLGLGLVVLLADLWIAPERRRRLGYFAAAGVGAILLLTFIPGADGVQYAFGGMFVQDGLAMFFKRLFLAATVVVLLLAVESAGRVTAGLGEYFALILFAATGMLLAASANDFVVLFVSLELVTITFYILVSFERTRPASLEAGVKYLIIGALSSAFMVFGLAFVYGTAGSFHFGEIAAKLAAPEGALGGNMLFQFGLLFVLAGLGFKLAVVPFQVWAPDVYQGAPTPTAAFLAVGSKAAGAVLLVRVLFSAVPGVAEQWALLFAALAALTILYGNLCALPQTNLKRLLGYSSIAHAGYLLLGVAAMSAAGQAAILYYLAGYLFAVLAAFAVITVVMRETGAEDIGALGGLQARSPLLATAMTLAMVSLAGIPPLAGFFGKFLLIKAVLEAGAVSPLYYALFAVAVIGVVISLAYYFGVVKAIYWGRATGEPPAPVLSPPMRGVVLACMAGIVGVGVYPNPLIKAAEAAIAAMQ